MKAINRRQAFALGGGFVALALVPMAADARSDERRREVDREVHRRQGAGEGQDQARRLPEIAENGNTVPMSITVESPMTRRRLCQEVGDHPRRRQSERRRRDVQFHAAERVRRTRYTRIRLAADAERDRRRQDERRIVVHGQKEVKVTIGGCGG